MIPLNSTVMADAAAITNAQLNLEYTAIRSPIDGRTGNLTTKEGNVVKAPDDVLVTVTQIRPIYVAFAVPEEYLSAVRRRASEESLAVKAFAPGDTNDAGRRKLNLHQQHGGYQHRHHPAQGHFFEHQHRALARPIRANNFGPEQFDSRPPSFLRKPCKPARTANSFSW